MNIKYFEEVDINNLGAHYSKEVIIESKLIDIDLNFKTNILDITQIQKLNFCLNNIKSVIDKSWEWILSDYQNGDDVNEYISFHLDDFFADNPEEILEGTDTSLDNKDRFLQTLHVNRIGVYPSSNENYLVIDWMTNPDLSNYILVVNVNDKLELEYLTVES